MFHGSFTTGHMSHAYTERLLLRISVPSHFGLAFALLVETNLSQNCLDFPDFALGTFLNLVIS